MTAQNKRTLFLLYLRQISAGLLIYQPIFYNFIVSKSLNAADFSILLTAYNLGVLVLVVPAGYFSDKIGRKWALMTSNIAYTVGTLVLAFSHSLPFFILGELIYALAVSLDAGTHSAFLFEFLRQQKKEHLYFKYDAFGTFLFLFFGSVGTLFGGYLAEHSLQLPVLLTAALTSLGIPCAFFLHETKHVAVERVPTEVVLHPIKAHHKIFAVVLQILRTPALRWGVCVSIIWIWSRQFFNLYLPGPYFKTLELPLRLYGSFAAVLTFLGGLIALLSRRFIQKPDLRPLLLAGLGLIPLSMLFIYLPHNRHGMFGFFLYAVPYGLCTSITNSLLNRHFTDHKNRATFFALVDFSVRVSASCLMLWLGHVMAFDSDGIWTVLRYASTFTAIALIFLLPGIFKYGRFTQN